MKRLAGLPFLLLLVLFVLFEPTSGEPTREPIRIFAASSLTDALADVARLFHEDHPELRIVPQFGGSSDLARQILAGAPADLFFSADVRQMDRLESGPSRPRERVNLLSNRLVVVRSVESAPERPIATAEDLTRLERIAMADPEAVPAGVYARRYLESKGLWSRIRSSVVPTLDVRGALAAVVSGNVDAGFVYQTDAAIEPRVAIAYGVPANEAPPIAYVLAIVGADSRPEVRALFEFLRSPAAGDVFESYGFITASASP